MASDRQWIVAARPSGDIKESDFAFRREPIPEIGPGQFLIRNLLLSCDPAMHGWMAGTAGYMTPLGPGDVMLARTVGEIVQSHHPDFKPGERVAGMTGWQDYVVSSGRERLCGSRDRSRAMAQVLLTAAKVSPAPTNPATHFNGS